MKGTKYVVTIVFILIMLAVLVFVSTRPTPIPNQGDVELFIKNSVTYIAMGSNLTFISVDEGDGSQEFIYKFRSKYHDYGLQMEYQYAPRTHTKTIVVTVQNNSIMSAVVDGIWNEIEQDFIYQPTIQEYKNYAGQPDECAQITFTCKEKEQPFFDSTGCGCEPIPLSINETKRVAQEYIYDKNDLGNYNISRFTLDKIELLDCPYCWKLDFTYVKTFKQTLNVTTVVTIELEFGDVTDVQTMTSTDITYTQCKNAGYKTTLTRKCVLPDGTVVQ